MTVEDTSYANTDFDLKSRTPFQTLHDELQASCCILHYVQGDDGNWRASLESGHDDETAESGAGRDIMLIITALNSLSTVAQNELAACYLREFNIGFHCWDSWAYVHQVSPKVIRAVADAECSIALTLYPMRKIDGTPRE